MKARKFHLSNELNRGFTLIELLVVIAIIAILAALLLPALAAANIWSYQWHNAWGTKIPVGIGASPQP